MSDDGVRAVRLQTPMPDLLAAAAGVGLQLATTGTIATVAGAMVPPALLAAWRLDQATFVPRLARAARTLEVAGEVLDVDVPEVERLAERDEATTSLVGRVLAASADAGTAQRKVEALGRVLAMGLGAGDRVDEALMLARALDDLEAPHVRVLTRLGHGRGKPDKDGNLWTWHQTRAAVSADRARGVPDLATAAGGSHVALSVMGVLVRHGLVVQLARRQPDPQNPDRRDALLEEPVWFITELGTACLNLLRVPTRPWGPRRSNLEPQRDL